MNAHDQELLEEARRSKLLTARARVDGRLSGPDAEQWRAVLDKLDAIDDLALDTLVPSHWMAL